MSGRGPTTGIRLSIMAAALVVASAPLSRAVIYTVDDPRQTEHEFAAARGLDEESLSKRLAATGRLTCSGSRHVSTATANVTLDPRILITAAHVVCEAGGRADTCVFGYTVSGHSFSAKVSRIFRMGRTCIEGGAGDWAVLILSRKAEGITPYSVDRPYGTLNGNDVMVVADHAIDFCSKGPDRRCLRGSGGHGFILPRFVEECTIRNVARKDDKSPALQLDTDCASSAGTSGGAVLSMENRPVPALLGIVTGTDEDSDDILTEKKTGFPVIQSYSIDLKDHHVTSAVPADMFRDAVADAIAEVGIK